MASSTDHRKTILLPILLSLTMINYALTLTLSALGISDVHLMLHFSHINIVIALIMTIYLMIRGIRNNKLDKGFVYTVIIAMTFAAIGVASDLARYLITNDRLDDTSYFTRIGVLIFVSLLGIHLIRKRTRLAIDKERAVVMEKMAYTDSLTGLANRAAFHEKEKEVALNKTDCIIIQLDINYLKTVNDKHGHAEGDRHITKAAHIIQECFKDIGTSYRTGGDEFIVIANCNDITVVEDALDKIDECAKQYNAEISPPVSLQIAYGYAELDHHKGSSKPPSTSPISVCTRKNAK